jgi:hypothetical protein
MRTAIAVAGLQFIVVILPPLNWPLDFLELYAVIRMTPGGLQSTKRWWGMDEFRRNEAAQIGSIRISNQPPCHVRVYARKSCALCRTNPQQESK